MRALLEVYVLSEAELAERYPSGFSVPPPLMRASGNVVVLQDLDPDDAEVEGCRAVAVSADVLERKLFGNPFVHSMALYLSRIVSLAGETSDTTSGDEK